MNIKRSLFAVSVAAISLSVYSWTSHSVTGSPHVEQGVIASMLQRDEPIIPTSSGSYLASRAAQHRNEWREAAAFLDQALKLANKRKSKKLAAKDSGAPILSGPVLTGAIAPSAANKDAQSQETVADVVKETIAEEEKSIDADHAALMELKQRVLIFQLGAGDYDSALEQAEDLVAAQNIVSHTQAVSFDQLGFAQSVLAVEAMRNKDFDALKRIVNDFEPGAVSDALRPLFDVWHAVAAGVEDVEREIKTASLMPLHEIYALEVAGKTDQAAKKLEYLNKRADNAASQLALAIFYARHDRMEEARNLMSDMIVDFPEDVELLDLYSDLKTPERIRENATYKTLSAHMLGPNHAMAVCLYDLAVNHLNNRSEETALLLGQLAYALSSDVTQVNFLLADILKDRGNYEQALRILDAVPQNHFGYGDAAISKAEIYMQMDRLDKAHEVLENALKNSRDAELAYHLAGLYRTDEQYDKALEAYDKVIDYAGGELPDRLWGVYYYRGIIHHEQDDWDKAEEQLLKAKAAKPDNPYVLNYLGYSWVDMNRNVEEALQILQMALDLKPRSGFITDSVGWAYYKIGNFEKATYYLERAAELMPYDPEINDHLGDVYWKTGRKLEAYYQWNRAIEYAEADDKNHQKIVKSAKAKMQSGL